MNFCGVGSHHKNTIAVCKVQTLTLVSIILLLYAKIYCPEAITTMLCPCFLKLAAGQLNNIKVDEDGFIIIEACAGTILDTTLKLQHTRGFPVYVINSWLQN